MVGTYIPRLSHTSHLRENLNFLSQAPADADAIDAHGVTVMETYKATEKLWRSVDSHVTFPGDTMFTQGFEEVCQGNATTVTANIKLAGKAIKDFSAAIAEFKVSTYDPLLADIAAFNALHPREYTAFDRMAHNGFDPAEGFVIKDPLPTETRTAEARNRLVSRLTQAEKTYDSHVEACVAALRKTSGPGTFMSFLGKANSGRKTGKDVWDLGKHLAKFANGFGTDAITGKLLYEFSMEMPSFAQSIHGILPKGVSKLEWLKRGIYGKWGEVWKDVRGNGWPKGGNYVLDETTGVWKVHHTFNTGRSVGPRGVKVLGWIEDAGATAKKITESNAFKWGGRALTAFDIGMGYYDSYQSNYNEALRAQPHLSSSELQTEALVGGAIEGTAKTAGKLVGGYAGRALGAAAGQALIPIPGVGAAVGGFVGGIVGEKVGGVVGEKVGGLINDVRREGWSAASDNVVKAAKETWDGTKKGVADTLGKVVTGIGSVTDTYERGKELVGGVKKLFGWGR